MVAAHGVDRDGEQTLAQPTSTACRPPYQPQLVHTTWGTFACRHWGQMLRGGALRVQLDARRLRDFIFDVFFLGTAIGRGAL
jgi:hypothetical protein